MKMKKQYKDLKQLDRIEYFLLNEKRKDYHIYSISFLNTFIWLSFIIIILALLVYIAFGAIDYINFMEKIYPIFKLFKPIMFIVISVDIIQIYVSYKKKNKLDRRFGLN